MKRILTVLLVIALIIVLVPAKALSDDTVISAEVEESYTIWIPEEIDFGTKQKDSGTYSHIFAVFASDIFIRHGEQIRVTFTSCVSWTSHGSFLLMHDTGEPEWGIPYTLSNSTSQVGVGDDFATFTSNGSEYGEVVIDTAYIDYPGSYSDTMTFTITCS